MKRILALLLALVMLFCLTACGEDEADTPTGENTGASTYTTESTNDTTESTQDSAQGTTEIITGGETTETTESPTTTPPETTSSPTTTTPATTPPSNESSEDNNINKIKEQAKALVGRWYLKSYADVYIDIEYNDYGDSYGPHINMNAENFSLPDFGVSGPDDFHINSCVIYPHRYISQHPEGVSWNSSIMVRIQNWKGDLSTYKIQIKDNSIFVDSYEFIRTKGNKTETETVTPPTTEPPTTEPPTTEPHPVRVSGVQISKTTLSLNIGDTQQLTATVSPSNADNKNVIWSSSNSSVAQVSSAGKITAKGAGSATITVTTVDGNYTAKCTVTVAAPPATEPPTTEPPATEPVSDVLIISNTQTISNQTIDTDVYITSTGVATFNNVTVNGNIYCYGQLKCSGCTANNVYAYAYGSMMSCGAFDGTHGKVSGGINCNNMTILDNALDYAFNKWGKS